MERLVSHFRNLLKITNTDFQRYIYNDIRWEERMIAIVGPRGVGKTTLLLQHIKLTSNVSDALYVSADDFYFAEHRLFDVADQFQKAGGSYLFIDEIHKYEFWSKEIKMMYDYFPAMHFVFTGSSILDLYRGSDDLSRRVVLYHLQGLSFREYLDMFHHIRSEVYSLEEIIHQRVDVPEMEHPLVLFKEYLEKGYYPFAQEGSLFIKLQNVINLTLETDIPLFAKMNIATSRKLKQLLMIISQCVPFKPNMVELAKMLDSSRNSVSDYLYYMEKAGIVEQLRNSTGGIRNLGKVEKVYLDNPNLIHLLAEEKPNVGNVRETFFLNQMRVRQTVFSSPVSDFMMDGCTFEVGGKNKKQKQIEGVDKGYVVKDDIEYGFGNVIPLWHFGMNY